MALRLPGDFKEFLKLFNSHGVRYLLIGGYAVVYHGVSRATGDLDVWIAMDADNAARVVSAIREFGFNTPDLSPDLFLTEGTMVRMGNAPLRIEVLTAISGVEFAECYAHRVMTQDDGIDVPVINLAHLKANKRASGRHKDLMDLEHFDYSRLRERPAD
jgi:hypothetical protein